jgi:adenylate kinase family enzyme
MIFIFTGPPGAGKTTCGKGLSRFRQIKHVSAGDVARSLADTDLETREALVLGQVAPRAKMNQAMIQELRNHFGQPGPRYLIVDGYPRYMEQMADLLTVFAHHQIVIFNLQLSDTQAWLRLDNRRREDDTIDAIQQRMTTFKEETQPMIEWASRRLCYYYNVDASREQPEVLNSVFKMVGAFV